jgi:hypothetical protein
MTGSLLTNEGSRDAIVGRQLGVESHEVRTMWANESSEVEHVVGFHNQIGHCINTSGILI